MLNNMKNIYTHFCIMRLHLKQAFDSIAGNTLVPYRSLKRFFYYHKLLYFAIYNIFCQIVLKSDFK